jgi:hypothetical protein
MKIHSKPVVMLLPPLLVDKLVEVVELIVEEEMGIMGLILE